MTKKQLAISILAVADGWKIKGCDQCVEYNKKNKALRDLYRNSVALINPHGEIVHKERKSESWIWGHHAVPRYFENREALLSIANTFSDKKKSLLLSQLAALYERKFPDYSVCVDWFFLTVTTEDLAYAMADALAEYAASQK